MRRRIAAVGLGIGCLVLGAAMQPAVGAEAPGLELDVMNRLETPAQLLERVAAERKARELARRAQLRQQAPERVRSIQRDVAEQALSSPAGAGGLGEAGFPDDGPRSEGGDGGEPVEAPGDGADSDHEGKEGKDRPEDDRDDKHGDKHKGKDD